MMVLDGPRLQGCWAHLKRDIPSLIDSYDKQVKRLGHDIAFLEVRKHWQESIGIVVWFPPGTPISHLRHPRCLGKIILGHQQVTLLCRPPARRSSRIISVDRSRGNGMKSRGIGF